jgi:uncharacterized protein (TIGR03000 family)
MSAGPGGYWAGNTPYYGGYYGSGYYGGGYWPNYSGYRYGYSPYYYGYDRGYYSPYYYSSDQWSTPGNFNQGGYYNPSYSYSGSGSPAYWQGDMSGYGATEGMGDPNAVHISARVPADAEIWVEGQKTSQRGPDRFFVSPPLTPGKTYTYDIKARWKQDGRDMERERHLTVRAGENYTVDFLRSSDTGRTTTSSQDRTDREYGAAPSDRPTDVDRNARPGERSGENPATTTPGTTPPSPTPKSTTTPKSSSSNPDK